MRDRITVIIAIILLAVVTGTSYWYSISLNRSEPVPRPAPGTADFIVDKLVLTQFDAQGRARLKLFGDKMTHYPEHDDIDVSMPRLVSLRPDQARVEVSARTARVENAAEKVHLNGDVMLKRAAFGTDPPMQVATEYLLALPDEDRYRTDKPVRIARGNSTAIADRMAFDNTARTLDLDGSVHTVIAPRSDKGH
jgi:lipopolysaccharide export system protein LptC